MNAAPVSENQMEAQGAPIHWPCLGAALVIMSGGTLYPPMLANAAGHADHALAAALFWAMSAGFVRGVGFVPARAPWRWLLSGWSCSTGLIAAVLLALLR